MPTSTTLDVALDHYNHRQSLVNATGQVAGQMWSQVDPNRIADTWINQLPELTAVVSGAQLGAARAADPYITAVLDSEDVASDAASPIDPGGFSGTASDGRGLIGLLTNPVVVTLLSIQDGMDVARALGMGRANLDMLVRTQVADAGRAADQVSLTARPKATGYTRIAVGNSCARCLLLSGKTYRWSAGFQRHPRCDCIHVPTGIARAGFGRSTWRAQDPRRIYDRMTVAERIRSGISKADQRAIELGADLDQVINAHRGLYTAGGRDFTREGATKRGLAGSRLRGGARITPDQIFREAGDDRDEALRLLYRHGYLMENPARVLATLPGGSAAGALAPPFQVAIRPALAKARSIRKVEQVFTAEARRLTGRDIPVTFRNHDVDIAADHAEGVLRALEQFPDVDVDIRTALVIGHENAYGLTLTGPRQVIFNPKYASDSTRYRESLRRAGASRFHLRGETTPVGTGVHEVAHMVHHQYDALALRRTVTRLIEDQADALGMDIVSYVRQELGEYALKHIDEMIAAAVADALTSGAAASRLSQGVLRLMKDQYARGRAVTAQAVSLPKLDLTKLTVPQLKDIAAARGITVPARARKADILALLEQPTVVPRAASITDRAILTKARAELRRLEADRAAPDRLAAMERAQRQIEGAETRILAAKRRPVDPGDASNWETARARAADDVGKALSELDEMVHAAASARAIEHRLTTLGYGLHPDLVDDLIRAGRLDRAEVDAAIDAIADRHGLVRVTGRSGDVEPFDPAKHEIAGRGAQPPVGSPVRVFKPSWAMKDSDRQLSRASVSVADDVPSVRPTPTRAPVTLVGEPSTGLSVADQARVTRLVGRDPQIFATVRDRFGGISTSGNLSNADAAWLQGIYERERAFVERAAQRASIKRDLDRDARKAGQTPAEYRRVVAERLKAVLDDKPVITRVRDDEALLDILTSGRFKTQFDRGVRRAPGLGKDSDRRRLGEQVLGVDPDISPELRPVYGYVGINGVEPALAAGRKIPGIAQLEGQEDVLSSYGKIQVVFKPSVRARTTATAGDSLDEIGFVRPSPIDSPSAESLGVVDLEDFANPAWTRRRFVEAQIHGGVRVDDIDYVVFPDEPAAAIAAALREHGITWRVLRPGDPAITSAPIPVAPARAVKPVVTSTRAAVARQAAIDKARAVGDLGADVLEQLENGLSAAALRTRITQTAARHGTPDKVRDALLAAVNDPAALRQAVAAQLRGAKLDIIGDAGAVVRFDRKTMQAIDGTIADAAHVQVVRPGLSFKRGTETIQISKATVEPLTAAEVREIERRAVRAAARERNRLIESRAGTARLLAEVDELIAKGAEARIIRQRLDPALIGPEQPFANADPAILEALRKALDTSPAALRSAVTRATTKAGLKPVSKAGAKVKFDPDTMESVSGVDIPAGAQVTVVTRGASVTLPDGTVLQLSKARVTAVAKPVKAAPNTTGSPAVDALPTGKPPSVTEGAKATNPQYGTTADGPSYRERARSDRPVWTPDLGPLPSGAFEENCTNVVMAYEMRMRGYLIEAAPLDVLDKYGYAAGRTFDEVEDLLERAWRLPNGKPHGRTFRAQQWRSFAEVDAEILRDWPDGARGFIFVGKHVFNVIKVRGKVQYIEAQFDASASRVVTTQYRKKYGGPYGQAKLMRLDDLVPADGILETVRPA